MYFRYTTLCCYTTPLYPCLLSDDRVACVRDEPFRTRLHRTYEGTLMPGAHRAGGWGAGARARQGGRARFPISSVRFRAVFFKLTTTQHHDGMSFRYTTLDIWTTRTCGQAFGTPRHTQHAAPCLR